MNGSIDHLLLINLGGRKLDTILPTGEMLKRCLDTAGIALAAPGYRGSHQKSNNEGKRHRPQEGVEQALEQPARILIGKGGVGQHIDQAQHLVVVHDYHAAGDVIGLHLVRKQDRLLLPLTLPAHHKRNDGTRLQDLDHIDIAMHLRRSEPLFPDRLLGHGKSIMHCLHLHIHRPLPGDGKRIAAAGVPIGDSNRPIGVADVEAADAVVCGGKQQLFDGYERGRTAGKPGLQVGGKGLQILLEHRLGPRGALVLQAGEYDNALDAQHYGYHQHKTQK
ncbi:hypothetical protein DSECCO2_573880 [anaerobic digester metagenome]